MRAVDTNVLVYADREETPEHHVALKIIRELAMGAEPWTLPWPCVYDFLRVVMHPGVFHPPTPTLDAREAVEALIDFRGFAQKMWPRRAAMAAPPPRIVGVRLAVPFSGESPREGRASPTPTPDGVPH